MKEGRLKNSEQHCSTGGEEMETQQILDTYYSDNARKLHGTVERILKEFGGIYQKDIDDFYSLANIVFTVALKAYDPVQDFDRYLHSCLWRKIRTEITRRNRDKRRIKRKKNSENGAVEIEYMEDLSIYTPVGDENGSTIGDLLPADFDIEKEVASEIGLLREDRVEKYLSSLSKIQRRMVEMRMEDVPAGAIKKELGLTDRQYLDHMKSLKSYEKKKVLFREKFKPVSYEEDTMVMEAVTTSEKTKDTSLAVSAISKKLRKHQIKDDHPLQRSSGQWKASDKSELISDILQGRALTQIIISEEIKEGITMHWLIDGKQRCTNIDDFINDGFAISKNIQIYNIQYQTDKMDEDGTVVFNEDGFPLTENKMFDIRGKKFSQLPEELRDKFLEYQVPVMMNLNCTKKEIAYDIARFNRCRPMNVAQNGWTGIDEDFAEYIDKILKMPFFQDGAENSSYRESNNRSGMMRRMIVESIMVSDFLDDFNKDFKKICRYLSEEANDSNFIEFYELIERLNTVANEEVSELFNIKDSFLWFGLFSRFSRLGMEDRRFVDFLTEFTRSLHGKKVGGESFDDMNEKSTKDKTIVVKKINLLETLMNEYFQISGQPFKTSRCG